MEVVSIVMPVYNAECYITDSINSVISQTYQDWELLIIDDCSSDNSPMIIQQFVQSDKRIKSFKTVCPSGSPVEPRNIGVKNAKGRFIAFLDSDDMWLPDKLERQVKIFEKNNDMAICFSNYEKISEDGERNGRIVVAPDMTTYNLLLYGNVIGCLTAMYDTDKTGKVFFENHRHEDYILWLDILKKGYVARNTNTVDALYRVRGHSVSSNKLKVLSWQWDIYRQVEHLGFLRSIYYFMAYAYKSFRKALI